MGNPNPTLTEPVRLVRGLVRRLQPYTPGEQPKLKGLIKLNTNENPYGPSPKVLRAVKQAVDGRLRLYPNPTAEQLREKLARHLGFPCENIIIGNGSDELLALATRAFVEPCQPGGELSGRRSARRSRCTIQYFVPSYSLYPVLADIHGAMRNPVPLKPDYGFPSPEELRAGGRWDFRAALTFITTPNAPSGRGYTLAELAALCRAQQGVVVLDEAYVDFEAESGLELTRAYPHVLVGRTFSKAYALCFQRVGYFVGHPRLIEALLKIKDSYNVNGLGQVAALATLEELPYYQANFRRIILTREWLRQTLQKLGFSVLPSQTNFILARPPQFPAEAWLEKLRARRILARWFKAPELRDWLRISVGSDAEAQALVRAARLILA
jgi:histidinol-phosphate aminotransferase